MRATRLQVMGKGWEAEQRPTCVSASVSTARWLVQLMCSRTRLACMCGRTQLQLA